MKTEIEPGDSIWIFNGDQARFPCAVFRTIERAEAWISRHRVSGVLTRYPVDRGVFDWAIEQGAFRPKGPDQETANFIQRFTSSQQEHFHYVDGKR